MTLLTFRLAKIRNLWQPSIMSSQRSEYPIKAVRVNGHLFERVIIDPHYKKKHADHMSDQLILGLVLSLNGLEIDPIEEKADYSYFTDLVTLEEKSYRLVWCIPKDRSFIGVINAFRDDRSEK